MKKLLVIALALFVGAQAHAQLVADGGYAHAMESIKYQNGNIDFKHTGSLDGLYLGARYLISLDNLVNGLAVAPGANLSYLFGKYWDYENCKVRELAINVPAQAMYAYDFGNDFKVFGLAGPIFQLGLSHKAKDSNSGTQYDLYNKDNHLGFARNAFNIYIGLAAGIQVADMIQVSVGFDFGLLNLAYTDHYRMGRNVLKIGVGYMF